MKLNEINDSLECLMEDTLPSIDSLPIDKLGINARKRISKVIPAIKAHFFVMSRKGQGGNKPSWRYTNESVEIIWTANTPFEAEKDLNTVEAVAKRVKSSVSYRRLEAALVEYCVNVPIGKVDIEERSITKFRTEVNLKVEIDTQSTKHSEERQEGRTISDSAIRGTVIAATERILQLFLDGKIQEGEKFHIYHPQNDHLNLIATFDMNTKGTPERIKIVTAIRTKNFRANDTKRTIKV